MLEGNRQLKVRASVIDGKLCIEEINPKGKSIRIRWSDKESWETLVIEEYGDRESQTMSMTIDHNGDGVPEYHADRTGYPIDQVEPTLTKYELADPQWVTVSESVTAASEQDRLNLIYARRESADGRDGRIIGQDFHAITWEKLVQSEWREVRRISKQEFESTPFRPPPVQRRLQSPPAKRKFLAVGGQSVITSISN